jgi:hypothetical protein
MNPPASRLIFHYFSNEKKLGLILQIRGNSYFIEFLRGADCMPLRVKGPPGNLREYGLALPFSAAVFRVANFRAFLQRNRLLLPCDTDGRTE